MPSQTLHWRLAYLLLACQLLLFPCGCAKAPSGPLCFPTQGKVTLDSQPLAEAMVVLHPLDPDPEDANDQRPIAITAADGTFHLSTLKTRDGAPAGEYAITVELREKRMDGDTEVRDGKNLLPPHYRDPAKSKLSYRVIEGDNQIPTLELSSK